MIRSVIRVPEVVRIKPGALDRLGLYLYRASHFQITLFLSAGAPEGPVNQALKSLDQGMIRVQCRIEVVDASVEEAVEQLSNLPLHCQAIVGLGGGKALDTAKYVASLAGLPYYAVPTSLSNDGFCSPQSSLTLAGKRKSLVSAMPFAVVIDTAVCLQAPVELWCSGIGDLAAKFTAVTDWKLAFHAQNTPVNDLAALLSDATVFQFIGNPERTVKGVKLLATALMLNGMAMEMAGSSRPASGSEHLISHALDVISTRPRLHGLQVGVAAYLVSHLQRGPSKIIAELFEKTGFWDVIRQDPFQWNEWIGAINLAPILKEGFYTVLSSRDCLPELEQLIETDPWLQGVFIK